MEGNNIIARGSFFEDILCKLTVPDLEKRPISLYICGKPGTGKTYIIDNVINEIRKRKNLNRRFQNIAELNGMEISSSSDI